MQRDRWVHTNKIHDEDTRRWTPEFFGPVFQKETHSLPQVMELHTQNRRTRILATMVPDQLIYKVNLTQKELNSFIGIILLAEVSGTMKLHEMYKDAGHGGSMGLNFTLNSYFGYMVQAICSYGGDVFKITGNGLLAIWNVREDELIFNTLHEVITCGLRIQETIGRFPTDVGVTLKLKLAISSGNLTMMVIGKGSCYNYLIAGSPMEEAKLAKKACLPGDLMLAGSAWGHCNPSYYDYVIKDTYNVKIRRVATLSKPAIKKNILLPRSDSSPQKRMPAEEQGSRYWESIDPFDDLIVAARPAISEAVVRRFGRELRKFVIHSVVSLIENEEPLEYLTGLRRVTSVFINVIPIKLSTNDLMRLVDNIFILLSDAVHDRGYITRVSLFHKDICFSILFGLQETANDSDSKNSLLTAFNLRKSIKNCYGVQKVSIGVTTGMAHCAIVGHPLRREHIVIGLPLQKATELGLMCIEKVTCDLNTLLRSDLPQNRFLLQEDKVLKGIGLSSIYEFIDATPNIFEGNVQLGLVYPILGRSIELDMLGLALDDIGLANRDPRGILLKGEAGSGKSRLLDGFVTVIRSRDIATTTLILTPDHALVPYSTIYPILAEVLDIDEYCSVEVREHKMVKRIGGIVSPQNFCYLNELMRVRFPISKRCSMETERDRQAQTTKLLKEIFHTSTSRRCILIDDVHNIDPMSWNYLSLTLDVNHIMLILSIGIPLRDAVPKSVTAICSDKRMTHWTVKPLSSQCITALACQIFDVHAIPELLERGLLLRTHNNPSYCQALLTAALSHGDLQCLEMTPKKAVEYNLVFSAVDMLSKIPLDTLPEDVAPALPWDQRFKVHVCLVSNYPQLLYGCQNIGLHDVFLHTYSQLSSHEQGLLKSAAMLGIIFTRYMLQTIMPNFSNFHTSQAITNLFNLRILYCASLIIPSVNRTETFKFCTTRKRKTFADCQHLLHCYCSDPQITSTYNRQINVEGAADELPWYSKCKFLAFKMPRFQKIVYDLISDIEKRELHIKAVDLYRSQAHKCKACGGGHFLDMPSRLKTRRRTTPTDHSNFQKTDRQNTTANPERVELTARRVSMQPTLKLSWQNEQFNYRADTPSEGRKRVSILPFYVEENDQSLAASESLLELPAEAESEINHRVMRRAKCCDWVKQQFWNKSAVEPMVQNSRSIRVPRLSQFRDIDLRNCQCSLILNNIYSRLLYHSSNTGDIEHHIQFLIDYGAGLIWIAEYRHAIRILTRADELNKKHESFRDDANESLARRMVIKGIILSLIGEAYVQLGYYNKARRTTVDELAIYGYTLSTTKIMVCHQIISNERRYLAHQWFSGPSSEVLTAKDTLEKNRISAGISRLSSIFTKSGKPRLAKLMILLNMNISEKCKDQPIMTLCSYRLAMLYYRQIGEMRFCHIVEKAALRIIANQVVWNDLQGVLAVASVYESIFYIKLITGKLRKAIEYGFKALQIAGKFHSVAFRLEILPTLIQAMIQAKRISETVDLLHELAYLAQEDVDMSSTIWYYALCLDLLLDAGVSVESIDTCHEFAKNLIDTNGKGFRIIVRDPNCSKRLLTNIWLLRTRMGVDFSKYYASRDMCLAEMRNDNYSSLWTALKAVEGGLLKITYSLNYKKGSKLGYIEKDVMQLLARLTKASRIAVFLKPRLYLLKAYMNVIRGRKTSAKRAVEIALKNARRQANVLSQASIELHQKVWLDNYPATNVIWSALAGKEDHMNWQAVYNLSNDDFKRILYCLPKPESYL